MLFLLWRKKEECVTSHSGCGESRIYKQHIQLSCSLCAGESVSKSSCKTAELEAYRLDKDRVLPKQKLKSLAKRLHG